MTTLKLNADDKMVTVPIEDDDERDYYEMTESADRALDLAEDAGFEINRDFWVHPDAGTSLHAALERAISTLTSSFHGEAGDVFDELDSLDAYPRHLIVKAAAKVVEAELELDRVLEANMS